MGRTSHFGHTGLTMCLVDGEWRVGVHAETGGFVSISVEEEPEDLVRLLRAEGMNTEHQRLGPIAEVDRSPGRYFVVRMRSGPGAPVLVKFYFWREENRTLISGDPFLDPSLPDPIPEIEKLAAYLTRALRARRSAGGMDDPFRTE